MDETRRWRMWRRVLQAAIIVGGCVPVGAGLAGVLRGIAVFDALASVSLSADSHVRYLSGLLLGIGLAFWSTVPQIERRTERFTILSLIVFVGGLGRLLGAIENGLPDTGMRFGLGMELIVTPLLCLAQLYLARAGNQRQARP